MSSHLFLRHRISLLRTLKPNPHLTRTISGTPFLSQDPQLASESTDAGSTTALPPNPATGSPLYQENWRSPIPSSPSFSQSLVPMGFLNQAPAARIRALSESLDVTSLLNMFADWTASQRWSDMKQLFEFWVRSLDGKSGKPNKPDVNLYNHYLRANLMMGASPSDMLDLVALMDDFSVAPNTASYNLVLKAMHQAKETEVAEKLLNRMLMSGKDESRPDDESYDLVIGMMFSNGENDKAMQLLDIALKSGYMLSTTVFSECVRSCVAKGRTDTLVSIIERCKALDRNKSLCPSWILCTYMAEVATQEDNSKLAFYAFEFMYNWINRGEMARPSVLLSVDEGLVVSALATAARTCNPTLVDGSWMILKRSLRGKKAANPAAYVSKINAYASLGNLQKAFIALHEFENAYKDAEREAKEEMLSPFTSLYPLVVACSKKGFETLDEVYFQLETLSKGDTPYKSVAALNCIILGCANTWDLDRAYQTFDAISASFGMTPNIDSYNALIYAFGKVKKTPEATRVYSHLVGEGVKPDTRTFSLLVDAHLINRDPKSALTVIDDMIKAGFEPSKETLKKLRRRCIREVDNENDEKVEALAKKFQIRMGSENRRNMLFNMDYSRGRA
ncbi:Pentatricopeptide repeat-containing protein [Raphanus sativus]|uniref:Pentatricopeptide repeat-containing protein At1g26460, mitochondrial n=1 Tax=Raphanus sativus TaxID=3726 RepID=A0A6J0NHE0_RAPSA|nr:pentatricopeptide repeat-containing protein At1g26460, mitochondrial [Raphanus sativus]XP_018484173.2 pentatricopeptide repeat-containing protein At1g26460, mitochondrial [Raphanus sativus]KAJ4916606.1 Pentatricopeptide repeat-containing protein [Raphanus sativus]